MERYDYGPLGLEQSFTIISRPGRTAAGPLTLGLGELPRRVDSVLAGDGRSVSLTLGGRVLLRYWGLAAADALGRALPARIVRSGRRVSLRIDDRAARYPLRVDPFVQTARLTASDAAFGDSLGYSVAISGDTIVAGAISASSQNGANRGAVYVFVKPSAGGWASMTQTAKLTASDGASGDTFGYSVAISGDVIVAGARTASINGHPSQGAVYVFVKPAGGWIDATQTAKLTASDGVPYDELGYSVAISGNTIAASASQVPSLGTGRAYVFVKPPPGWASGTETAKLTASDGTEGDVFGQSVAISNDTVVVGSSRATVSGHTGQGAAYVFVKPGGGWASSTQTAKLTASDGASNDGLGTSVAIAGDTLVAGAPGKTIAGQAGRGAAYVFVKPAAGWAHGTQTARLVASDGAGADQLGFSVGICPSTILAGAPGKRVAGNQQGTLYVFAKPAGGWGDNIETQQLTASDGAQGDELGYAAAISGDGGTVIGGTPFVGSLAGNGAGKGAAYVFSAPAAAVRPTSTSVSCSPAPVTVGQPTTCTATVSDLGPDPRSTPTGTVSFATDSHGTFGNPGATCTLDAGGSCQVDYTPAAVDAGTHKITASYGGDGTHAASGGSASVTVTAAAPPPSSGNGGGGNGGGGIGNGGGGLPAPPIARFSVGRAAALPRALSFNAAASVVPPGVGVRDYAWDSSGNGNFDWHCGDTPVFAEGFQRPGEHAVGLRVVDTLGRTSTTYLQVNVPASVANGVRPTNNVVDCENLGAGNQPDRSDCVKSFGFGILDVNSRGRRSDCFQITAHFVSVHGGASARAAASPVARGIPYEYNATVYGPVAVNGLFVPVPEAALSEFDSRNQTMSLGRFAVSLGPFKTQPVDLRRQVVSPDRHGVYHLDDVLLSGANAVLGALPVKGNISIDLLDRHSRTTLSLALPKPFSFDPNSDHGAQGKVFLFGDNVNGINLDGVQISKLDAFLGPLTLKNLFFTYNKSEDTWSGGADVYMPGSPLGINAAPPPPELGFGMRGGGFDHAGIGVDFYEPAQPQVFPGIFLTNIHAAIGVRPTRFTGGLGLKAGRLVAMNGDLFAAFASPQEPYRFPSDQDLGTLAPLAGRTLDTFSLAVGGTANLTVPGFPEIKLGGGYVLYEYPDFFEFGGGIDFGYSFVKLTGGVSGFVALSDAKFNLEGQISACLRGIRIFGFSLSPCLSTGAILSTRGIGFCGTVPIPVPFPPFTLPVTFTVGYRWGADFPEVGVLSCDFTDFREANPHAASAAGSHASLVAGSGSFTLPAGLPSAMVRVTGQGGAPDVILSGPHGERISTADPPRDPNLVVVKFTQQDRTLIAVRHPAAGRWNVTSDAGSVPVTDIASANGLPAPNVTARVTGRGRTRTLHYRLTAAPGRTVIFEERGARTYRLIGIARGARGRIRFSPADGRAGIRVITAIISEGGVDRRSFVVARYGAPPPVRPARPRNLRVTRAGTTLAVHWGNTGAAVRYAVVVSVAGGEQTLLITRSRSVRVTAIPLRLGGTVTVKGLRSDNRPGPAAQIAFGGRRQGKRR